jgi:hypothetical protein
MVFLLLRARANARTSARYPSLPHFPVRAAAASTLHRPPFLPLSSLPCACPARSDVCGYETYQEVIGKAFTPLCDCVSDSCRANKTPGAIRLAVR